MTRTRDALQSVEVLVQLQTRLLSAFHEAPDQRIIRLDGVDWAVVGNRWGVTFRSVTRTQCTVNVGSRQDDPRFVRAYRLSRFVRSKGITDLNVGGSKYPSTEPGCAMVLSHLVQLGLMVRDEIFFRLRPEPGQADVADG